MVFVPTKVCVLVIVFFSSGMYCDGGCDVGQSVAKTNSDKQIHKLLDQVYLFKRMYGIKGQLCRSSFMELVSLLGICNAFFASTG